MNIDFDAYSDAEGRLIAAKDLLAEMSGSVLDGMGRGPSNALYGIGLLIEDALGIMEAGLIRNSQPSESSSEPQSGL